MRKKKRSNIYDISSYFLGMLFNLILFIVTAFLIYTLTLRGFDEGKRIASEAFKEREYMEIEITIPTEATLTEVSDLLEDKGIIKNSIFFKIENILKGSGDSFPGGTYLLNTEMDSNKLNSVLRNYTVLGKDVTITIKEYFTIKDISKTLEDNKVIKAADFIKACDTEKFELVFLEDLPARSNPLEGYLFPDTYFVTQNSAARDIILKLLYNFDDKFNMDYRLRAKELGYTMDEIIIIASIIEKEVRVASERAQISEIIHNRLKNGMNLEMASTVLYTLAERKEFPTEAEIQTPSPYNTYLNPGLPIGPICNPGVASIKAALYPTEGKNLYFALKDDDSGEHVFSEKE